jgi:hypothetical protein
MAKKIGNPTRIDIKPKLRESMIGLLNAQLADTLDLYTQVKQAHWNVRARTSSRCTSSSTSSPRTSKSRSTISPNASRLSAASRAARHASPRTNRESKNCRTTAMTA